MPTYSTLGRSDNAIKSTAGDVPPVHVNVALPELADLIDRMEKRDAQGGQAPVVHIAPAAVNVYPEIKPEINVTQPEVVANFNVPVPVVNMTIPDFKLAPITVDLLIPKVPFIMLSGGVYLLLATMVYMIIALNFPEMFGMVVVAR